MPRIALVASLIAILAMTSTTVATAAGAPARPALATGHPVPVLAAFRSFRFGGSRSRGYGYGFTRRRHGLLRRVVKTAIWLYVLHLFFAHGGLSILLWLMIIGLVISVVRRRRRRLLY